MGVQCICSNGRHPIGVTHSHFWIWHSPRCCSLDAQGCIRPLATLESIIWRATMCSNDPVHWRQTTMVLVSSPRDTPIYIYSNNQSVSSPVHSSSNSPFKAYYCSLPGMSPQIRRARQFPFGDKLKKKKITTTKMRYRKIWIYIANAQGIFEYILATVRREE